MTTSTDTFETVQHFDTWANAEQALAGHLDAELQADIDGPRCYVMKARRGLTDWTIESFPAGAGTAREVGVFVESQGRLIRISTANGDFACCAGEVCPACGGEGSIKQQVYLGMKEPHHYSVCGNCGGTGRLQPEGHGE